MKSRSTCISAPLPPLPSHRVIGVSFTEVPEQMGSSARAITSVWFILLSGERWSREKREKLPCYNKKKHQ